MHKPIQFYSDPSHQSHDHNHWGRWTQESDDDENERVEVDLTPYFNKYIGHLVNNAKLLNNISKRDMKRFEKLWSGSMQTVMGLDGTMKKTRGLGYNSGDDMPSLGQANRDFFKNIPTFQFDRINLKNHCFEDSDYRGCN